MPGRDAVRCENVTLADGATDMLDARFRSRRGRLPVLAPMIALALSASGEVSNALDSLACADLPILPAAVTMSISAGHPLLAGKVNHGSDPYAPLRLSCPQRMEKLLRVLGEP